MSISALDTKATLNCDARSYAMPLFDRWMYGGHGVLVGAHTTTHWLLIAILLYIYQYECVKYIAKLIKAQ